MIPHSDLTKSQINRLGDRLRKGNVTDDDLRSLENYRLSFNAASDAVVEKIRSELNLEPTVRAKTRSSIIEKLKREKTRLSHMQDIAGCRVILADIPAQNHVTETLQAIFEKTDIIDRRRKPSHGYRAIHAIVYIGGKAIEVQVRTSLQHWWAELSEKFSDLIDPSIKYGGGNREALDSLSVASEEIVKVEADEELLHQIRAELARRGGMSENVGGDLMKAQQSIAARRKHVINLVAGMGEIIPED